MTAQFTYFTVFAEMRTGSNFLETNINLFDDLECVGEAFNPHLLGYPNTTEIAGVTRAMRDADPHRLIQALQNTQGKLSGFRFFHDHEPRVLDTILDDPKCGKIILTRNPVDSYVSWKIAQATGQWKLTNVKRRKDSRVRFDAHEFEAHLCRKQNFQIFLQNRLQRSGQTAFYLAYEDLQALDVLNGLGRFLGSKVTVEALDSSLKKQNPSPLSKKVSNWEDIEPALTGLDRFNLHRTPDFEPRRGPAAPSFVTAAKAPLMFLPIRSGPEQQVLTWMAGLDGVVVDDLPTRLNQKGLRQWKRKNPDHRSFSVVRHPVERAHHAFCSKILQTGPGTYDEIRKTLRNFHKVPLPGQFPSDDYGPAQHKEAFIAFLEFLKANLNGQTNIRVDAHWASQSSVLQGMAQFMLPDFVFREEDLLEDLAFLMTKIGYSDAQMAEDKPESMPFKLEAIYDENIETLAQDIYQRDYMMFGFRRWR